MSAVDSARATDEPTPGDRARATVGVAVEPEAAFRLFTEQMDLWWRRGQRFRIAPGDRGLMAMEAGVGGRVFESWHDDAGQELVREIGRVQVWQPPERLVFSWRGVNFAAGEETQVEVLFKRTASGNTQVSVEHRGWAALRADHPVRHGQAVPAFIRMMSLWWGDQLTTLRLSAVDRMPPRPPPETPATPR
ncbi:SRPBCC domain-containing protein [Ideonella sp. DXS29W]|uniref:SRPBCC domain-containing protein n=1 Tax=Ideonella lacteola TaxID=2984193 RepID=A0ABU9BPB3_9BURK